MSDPIEIPKRFAIHQGDALALLQRLPDASVDLLATDPPYSSGGMVRGDRMQSVNTKYVRSDSSNQDLSGFSGDNRDQRAFAYWSALWLSECLRVTKPGAPGLLFTDWRQVPSTTDAFQAGGWVWRGLVPWGKPNARPQKGRFSAACEFVVWGSNGPMPMVRDAPCLDGFFLGMPPRDREHVTQKPVELMTQLLAIAEPGSVVLDPFAGTGTTGVAALALGHRFIGFEMHAHHAETARARCGRAAGERIVAGEQVALL